MAKLVQYSTRDMLRWSMMYVHMLYTTKGAKTQQTSHPYCTTELIRETATSRCNVKPRSPEQYLLLNDVKVEVSFFAKRRVAVRVHHYGNILVDEAESEHVAIATLCVVKK